MGRHIQDMAVFGNIGPFDKKVELFEDCTDRCATFLVENRIDEELQASLFLAVVGADAIMLVKNLCVSQPCQNRKLMRS